MANCWHGKLKTGFFLSFITDYKASLPVFYRLQRLSLSLSPNFRGNNNLLGVPISEYKTASSSFLFSIHCLVPQKAKETNRNFESNIFASSVFKKLKIIFQFHLIHTYMLLLLYFRKDSEISNSIFFSFPVFSQLPNTVWGFILRSLGFIVSNYTSLYW